MLPVYKALSFVRMIHKGARTKPWIVLVTTGEDIVPYVVKMFETELIEKRDSVTNEVLGNILAEEFELPVANAALIEMDEGFRETINDPEAYGIYDFKDKRIKFGTRLMEGFNLIQATSFRVAAARRMIDIDELFAFDNLIRNRDRTDIKPNLLIATNKACLIDHELGFEIDAETVKNFKDGNWNRESIKYHLFYRYLSTSNKTTKLEYFATFEEYLKLLNVKRLDSYFDQLLNYGYNGRRHQILTQYLKYMKANSHKFVQYLRDLLE